jgi:hypothetical protein
MHLGRRRGSVRQWYSDNITESKTKQQGKSNGPFKHSWELPMWIGLHWNVSYRRNMKIKCITRVTNEREHFGDDGKSIRAKVRAQQFTRHKHSRLEHNHPSPPSHNYLLLSTQSKKTVHYKWPSGSGGHGLKTCFIAKAIQGEKNGRNFDAHRKESWVHSRCVCCGKFSSQWTNTGSICSEQPRVRRHVILELYIKHSDHTHVDTVLYMTWVLWSGNVNCTFGLTSVWTAWITSKQYFL